MPTQLPLPPTPHLVALPGWAPPSPHTRPSRGLTQPCQPCQPSMPSMPHLKVQVGHAVAVDAPPVAPKQRVRADEVERARHRPAVPRGSVCRLCQHQQHSVCHALAQLGEEGAREVGAAPLAVCREGAVRGMQGREVAGMRFELPHLWSAGKREDRGGASAGACARMQAFATNRSMCRPRPAALWPPGAAPSPAGLRRASLPACPCADAAPPAPGPPVVLR